MQYTYMEQTVTEPQKHHECLILSTFVISHPVSIKNAKITNKSTKLSTTVVYNYMYPYFSKPKYMNSLQ